LRTLQIVSRIHKRDMHLEAPYFCTVRSLKEIYKGKGKGVGLVKGGVAQW